MKLFSLLFVPCIFHQYCLAQKVDSIKPISMKLNVKAVPNPISNKLNLRVKNFTSGVVQVKVIDANGLTVYNDKRLVVLQEDDIVVFLQLQNGTYWCILSQGEKTAKCSFMVLK
jgi:hypothetical protein